MVDGDAHASCLLLPQTSSLDLLEGETPALTQLGVVLEGRASHGGAQRLERAQTESGGLGSAGITSALLGTGLVKPDLDPTLPILAEMVVVEAVMERMDKSVRLDNCTCSRSPDPDVMAGIQLQPTAVLRTLEALEPVAC